MNEKAVFPAELETVMRVGDDGNTIVHVVLPRLLSVPVEQRHQIPKPLPEARMKVNALRSILHIMELNLQVDRYEMRDLLTGEVEDYTPDQLREDVVTAYQESLDEDGIPEYGILKHFIQASDGLRLERLKHDMSQSISEVIVGGVLLLRKLQPQSRNREAMAIGKDGGTQQWIHL